MSVRKDKVQLEVEINGKKAGTTYQELLNNARDLNRELKQLTPGTEAFIKKSQELAKVNAQLKDIKAQTQAVAEEMRILGVRVPSALQKFGAASIAAIGAIVAIGGAALANVRQIVQETNEARQGINAVTGAVGDALDEQFVRTKALATTFNKDQKEVLLAANVLSKEFGITIDQALDNIQRGLVGGANVSGEFLENIREYSVQFAAAGASAEDFVNLSIKAQQEGIFSDKGQDVVKEFGLRIREQTKTTRDAMLSAFGPKFTDEIFGGINEGSLTTVQALQRVAGKMDDTKIPASQLQTVIADVFGGPGEDAGLRFIQLLGDVEQGVAAVAEETLVYQRAQQELLTANEDLAFQQNELAKSLFELDNGFNLVWTNLKTIGIAALNGVIQFIQEIPATFSGVSAAFGQFFDNIGNIVTLSTEKNKPVMRAYREAYIEALKPIEAQRTLAAQLKEEQDAAAKAAADADKNNEERRRRANQGTEQQLKAALEKRLASVQEGFEQERLLIEGQRIRKELDEQAAGERLYQLERQNLERRLSLYTLFGQGQTAKALEVSNKLDEIRVYEADRAQAALDGEIARLEQLGVNKQGLLQIQAEAEKGTKKAVQDYTQQLADAELLKYKEKTEAIAQAQAKLQEDLEIISIETFQSIGELTVDFFSQQKKDGKAFLKGFLEIMLSAIQKSVIANIAAATAVEAGTKPFPFNLGTTAIKIAAINAAFAVAKAAVKAFAGGGAVISGRRVTESGNIPQRANGDNVLATLRTGEVVLNESQQHMLGGPAVFRRIGVPGFALGGVVNTTPDASVAAAVQGSIGVTSTALLEKEVMAMRRDMARMTAALLAMPTSLKANVVYTELEAKGETLGQIRDEANA